MNKVNSITEATLNWASQRDVTVRYKPETESTNDDAKANALDDREDVVLYLTNHQTKGRGRGAHSWLDTGAGESLLCTWSLWMPAPPQAITAPRIGLILFEAVRLAWPSLKWSLKAPNDLLLNGKKCGGLLVEAVTDGTKHRLLVGIGFNVFNHPRRFEDATHLTEGLNQSVEEGEWFRFIDQLHGDLLAKRDEMIQPTLTEPACRELMNALNANPNRPFQVQKISPQGDIVHADGVVSWMEL